MRIALVSEHASPLAVLGEVDAGGQNVFVAALATELARAGDDVVVYTRRDDPALPDRMTLTAGVEVVHVEAGPPSPLAKDLLFEHMPAFADGLVSAWSTERPDVVHAHFWMSGFAAVRAARAVGAPVVQTFHALGVVKRRHQHGEDTSPPARLGVERRLLHDVDGIIATCSDEVTELRGLGAAPERVSVVPCGVDTTLFRPDGPCWPPSTGRPRLVCVSRLVPRKGIADAIEALAAVPRAELVVAGGPPLPDLDHDAEHLRLRGLAAEIGVADRVRFVGGLDRPAVAALMRSADALVCVPWYEPFGMVPVEAMACATPVIGSAVGGLLDTVVHGRTGVLVPPRRPDLVAAAARDLLRSARLRRRLGVAAAERAAAIYGWDRVAARTRAVYHALVGSRRAALEAP